MVYVLCTPTSILEVLVLICLFVWLLACLIVLVPDYLYSCRCQHCHRHFSVSYLFYDVSYHFAWYFVLLQFNWIDAVCLCFDLSLSLYFFISLSRYNIFEFLSIGICHFTISFHIVYILIFQHPLSSYDLNQLDTIDYSCLFCYDSLKFD